MSTPVSIFAKPPKPNPRGRVYRCQCCPNHDRYEGEKAQLEAHFYKKHVSLDQVPFYCNICKIVSTRQSDLEKHIVGNSFPTHKATVDNMRVLGQEVNEHDSLLMNIQHYSLVPDVDYIRLSSEESERIFSSRSRKQVMRANKENVGVQQVKKNTVPVANSQVLSNSKDVFLINTEQAVNPNLILKAENIQVPVPSEVITQVNNSVLRDVMSSKKVENIERSEVSGTVDVLKGILGDDDCEGQVKEFPETVEVNNENVNRQVLPNIIISGDKEGVKEQSDDNTVQEKKEKSDILSGIKVISSDMKIIGTFLEVMNKEIETSQQSLLRATKDLTAAVDRQTRAFDNLAEILSRNQQQGQRNFSFNTRHNRQALYNRQYFNRQDFNRQDFNRGCTIQTRRCRSRSPRRSRSASPERRIKFMKY